MSGGITCMVPSQDPVALADRSHRSLICELCDSLACLMFVTPSNNKYLFSD